MTSNDKINLLRMLKREGVTSSKQLTSMDARQLGKGAKSLKELYALLDLQDAVKADKSNLFDYLMSDDKDEESSEA